MLRSLCVLAATIGLLSAATSAHAACPGARVMPDADGIDRAESATRCLINDRREARERARLPVHPALQRAAERFATRMVREGFFSHVAPDGQTLSDRVGGYVGGGRSWSVGEVLAWATGPLATPRRVMVAWMASPRHRRIVARSAWRAVGVAVVVGVPNDTSIGATYVADFGSIAPRP
jgi:uncharacterized protein YkwD